ncbi:quinone oxidoreductase family protein [Chitinophaga vietnamensis]|uniref:quinone oxidoreductase family protein n=1 Tax=Chitinophaga vietnamensis TaxID=2593957 RepID=UPI001177510E|nr:zinc-binding dehydrogenase [Chitinophaga vietnamensis]
MQAIQLAYPGDTSVLTMHETPIPDCKNDEVLVRVAAVGLNYVDTLIRKGSHPVLKQFPAFMPGEVEGVITTVGSDVPGLRPGQRVTGYSNAGYAQFALISASEVTVLPDDLPLGQGMMIQHLTAQNLLHTSKSYASVLITAAAGGVGSSTVRIARLKGIPMIIGLTSSLDKAPYIRSLGATHVIIYTQNDWQEQISAITNNNGVDLILESVGGTIGSALLTQLSRGGTMVVYGNSSGQPSPVTLQSVIMSNTTITSSRLYATPLALRKQWADEIIQWIQSKQLEVAITAYPLAQAGKAHDDMEKRASTGRLILTPF